MKKLALILSMSMVFGFAGLGNATFIDNGGGLIYDTDLNITWYDYTYTARDGWYNAMDWANGLTVGGVSDWRLPRVLPDNNSSYNDTLSYNGSTGKGYNINQFGTGNEMSYLFYVELGNKALYDGNGNYPQPGYGLVNKGPFINLLPTVYWSGTKRTSEFESIPDQAWSFNFYDGYKGYTGTNGSNWAIAVHSGNVGAPVPEPATMLLLGMGLMGLAGVKMVKRIK